MEKKIYKCLVASPGDTKEERQICLKIFNEINKGLGESFRFTIEERMWEHNTRPSFLGEYSQATISDQLGNDYDLFVGIMNNKFGTETKVAGSGTEEEFNNAYQRLKNKENLDIMFYFNDAPVKKSELNSEDLNKINNFRNKVASLSGYYWMYNGASDFENQFRTHLTDYFVKLHSKGKTSSTKTSVQFEVLRAKFKANLDNALQAFSSQPIIWVDPVISNTNEISQNPDENYTKRIDVIEIINNPESIVFNAPPQFGLTSLARYLVLESWERGNFWLYLDSHNTKSHKIHNTVTRETESLGLKITDLKAIILDSWNSYDVDSFNKLNNLSETYKDIPIILMHTIEDAKFLNKPYDIKIKREFKQLFLLTLPRTQIRKVVAEYNRVKEIGIEDNVLTKVVSDLEVLNIHRTPMNCLTLLKVCEKYFDESPINRTDMIEKVLFVLFNTDSIPRYKTKPDLKDCEYVLGRYCELMIKSEKYCFSRDAFIKELKIFSKEKLIDLDVDVVFDVLVSNHIIVKQEIDFCFRSSFWIYYFAAKRMDNDNEFADYIFNSKKYISFPEIIEFYTGIDRNKIDALEIMTKDIKETCDIVNSKVRLTGNMNIFSLIHWQPTEEQIQKAQNQLSENVLSSGLPEDIKDQYADKSYNQIRPYNQSIHNFFAEYSLYNLMQNIKASSRALRNSDYVKSDAKRDIFNEILRSWELLSNVLLVLTPILADKGQAGFGGQYFILQGDFGETLDTRLNHIIQVNMSNVVGFFKDDIFSPKIAPLLYEYFVTTKSPNSKHKIALLLVFCRPRQWRKHIHDYILSLNKNSFYLYDLYNALLAKYNFDFITEEDRLDLVLLIKMCLARHELGSKNPTGADLKRFFLSKPKKVNE